CAVTALQKPKPRIRYQKRWRTASRPSSDAPAHAFLHPRCRPSGPALSAVEDTYARTLAGRPLQISSTQQMHVQMKHRLAGARTNVQHSAITVFNAALPRHPGGRKMT